MDFTEQQIASMEQRFVTDPFLRGEDLDALADELALTRNQVRAWFIDRRRRMRAVQQPQQQQQQQAQPDMDPVQQARRPGMAFLDNLLQEQNDIAALLAARQAHDLRMQQLQQQQQAQPDMQQPLQPLQRQNHAQQRLPPIIFPQQNLLQQQAAAQGQQDQPAMAPLLQPPQPLQQPRLQQLQQAQQNMHQPIQHNPHAQYLPPIIFPQQNQQAAVQDQQNQLNMNPQDQQEIPDQPDQPDNNNLWKYYRICSTEDYSIPRALIIPCGHVACTECVAKVVEANEGCTFCKGNIHSTKRLFE